MALSEIDRETLERFAKAGDVLELLERVAVATERVADLLEKYAPTLDAVDAKVNRRRRPVRFGGD